MLVLEKALALSMLGVGLFTLLLNVALFESTRQIIYLKLSINFYIVDGKSQSSFEYHSKVNRLASFLA